MPQIIVNLSKQPAACIILSVMLFLFSFIVNYLLLDSLLQVHRSKTAVKKIKKEYSIFSKLRLLHFKQNCLHAVKFCCRMILFQTIAWLCLGAYLLISLLYSIGLLSAAVIAWFSVGLFLGFDLPTFVINRVLARPIIFGRFRAFSFEKYHNTDNHESLL